MKIEIRNLTKTFLMKTDFEVNAIDNISFDILPGDFIALVGKSGSGKSTLATILTGIERPTSGSIFYEGIGTVESKTKRRKLKGIPEKVAMTFQIPNLQLFKSTVLKDVSFALEARGISKEEVKRKSEYFLTQIGVDKKLWTRSPFQLSEGQKRKVILSAILVADPDVIIFDEPTANLDGETRLNFLEIIDSLNKKGKTIIMITHDTEAANKYARKILTLDKGKLISFEDNKEVIDNE